MIRCVVLWALSLGLLTPPPISGQAVTIAPRITAMGGHRLSVSAGLRAHLEVGARGAFVGAAVRSVAQECTLTCGRPGGGGLDMVGGLRVKGHGGAPVQPFASAGAGVVYWIQDSLTPSSFDPLAELEGGLLFNISARIALMLAVRTDAVFGESRATFVGGASGVSVRLR